MQKQLLLMTFFFFCLVGTPYAELVDNGDGTVTDSSTNLIWQKDTARDGQDEYRLTTWDEALSYCESLDLDDKQDWRLPTIKELETIVDLLLWDPATDEVFSEMTASDYYWSSTSKDNDRDSSWLIDFENGDVSTKSKSSYSGYVRAIRGGIIVPDPENHFRDNGNGTVTDTRTGLVWQKETSSNLLTWEDAMSYCESLTLVNLEDWRLPTIKELESIVDLYVCLPAVDPVFQDTQNFGYWTSTTKDNDRDSAWVIDFEDGDNITKAKSSFLGYARAVRGSTITPKPPSPFQDNGDETITDTRTGLVWQKGTPTNVMTWAETLAYCEGLKLGERLSWRLPTIKELESIVDLSVCVPAIDPLFQETKNSQYWSSTTDDDSRSYAWVINFDSGSDGTLSKTYGSAYARAVYGGVTVIAYVSKVVGCDGKAPCYSTVQAALDATETGATIKIGQGTYSDPYTLNSSKTFLLQGGWDSTYKNQTPNTTFLKTPKAPQGSLRLKMVTIKP